jgi:polyisoprenoid-binding protein YceI
MQKFNLLIVAACLGLIAVAVGRQVTQGRVSFQPENSVARIPQATEDESTFLADVPLRYRFDPTRSNFMVRTFSGGLLWFKGHDHFIKLRDFSGEAELTPMSINPASLRLTIRAASLEETRDVFTPQQKQIINREINQIVLETDKYPEITFKSTDVSGKLKSPGLYEAKIGGELTLHGVTRHIVVPAEVSIEGNNLRARGEFEINRSGYNVKATSAMHGTIRVRNKLHFTFDIIAHRI